MSNRLNYEAEVKSRLYEIWSKPAYRTEMISEGWTRETVPLGKGVVRVQGTTPMHKMVSVIEDFGIPMDKLDQLNLNYDQINELYMNITVYRMSIKFLKDIKRKMDK